jgi:hypothetical protein
MLRYSLVRIGIRRKMTNLASDQLAAISRFFAASVIREMVSKGRAPMLARLARQSRLIDAVPAKQPVSGLFNMAFSLLKREGLRHKYIYKAALIEKILLGRHSLQTASILNEFRVGDCKADIAILNGTATVYEVKSERDSLSRLERQVAAYAKVFARVYVVAAENHISGVIASVPKDVGILRLNGRHQISTALRVFCRPLRVSRAIVVVNPQHGDLSGGGEPVNTTGP